jgi:hypothetical protein
MKKIIFEIFQKFFKKQLLQLINYYIDDFQEKLLQASVKGDNTLVDNLQVNELAKEVKNNSLNVSYDVLKNSAKVEFRKEF